MFSHVMIGTNDLDKAKAFYDKLLGTLEVRPARVDGHRIFYITKTGVISVSKPINGEPATYASSEHGRRQFCATCGTGLFYRNAEFLPGIVDIHSGTLDDPEAQPPGAHIMVKERLGWTVDMAKLPEFATYPGLD